LLRFRRFFLADDSGACPFRFPCVFNILQVTKTHTEVPAASDKPVPVQYTSVPVVS